MFRCHGMLMFVAALAGASQIKPSGLYLNYINPATAPVWLRIAALEAAILAHVLPLPLSEDALLHPTKVADAANGAAHDSDDEGAAHTQRAPGESVRQWVEAVLWVLATALRDPDPRVARTVVTILLQLHLATRPALSDRDEALQVWMPRNEIAPGLPQALVRRLGAWTDVPPPGALVGVVELRLAVALTRRCCSLAQVAFCMHWPAQTCCSWWSQRRMWVCQTTTASCRLCAESLTACGMP